MSVKVKVGYENCVEFVRKEVIPFRERTDLSKVRWESTKPLESLDYRSLYPVYTVSINTKYFSSYHLIQKMIDKISLKFKSRKGIENVFDAVKNEDHQRQSLKPHKEQKSYQIRPRMKKKLQDSCSNSSIRRKLKCCESKCR